MDRIDFAIVAALQNDGRTSNKELAASVGLAPSSCLQRVRRLRDDGVILGFTARVDPSRVGVALQALVTVQIRDHDPARYHELIAHVRALEEVVAIHETGGTIDLLLHVAVRDVPHLRDLVHATLTSHPVVRQVETMLLFHHEWRSLPLYPPSTWSR